MGFWICLCFVGTYGPALLKYSGFLGFPGFLDHSAIPAMVPEVLDFWISGFACGFGTYGPAVRKSFEFIDVLGLLAHMGRPS